MIVVRRACAAAGAAGRAVIAGGLGVALLVGFGPAQAGSKKGGSSAPAHVSAPGRSGGGGSGGGGGGGVHLPSGMGGGAHMPGSMGGGAHMPGSMGGGAHVPGSMGGGAHMPGSMSPGAHSSSGGAHGAHVPGSAAHVAGGNGHAAREAPGHDATGHDAGDRKAGGHETGGHETGGHETGGHDSGRRDTSEAGRAGRDGDHAGQAVGRRDPRMGGQAKLNTRGLDAERAEHHEPRPFLRADAHRDIARERDFVARHERDFHSRFVRDFSRRELAAWRRGLWRNEWHYGRRGWWWEVDGVWYDYEDPVWPYPVEVAPLVVYDTPYVDGPDLTAVEAGPDTVSTAAPAPDDAAPTQPFDAAQLADPGIPPLPPAPTGWFRCGTPDGYYPMLGTCTGPWQLVDDAPLPGAQ